MKKSTILPSLLMIGLPLMAAHGQLQAGAKKESKADREMRVATPKNAPQGPTIKVLVQQDVEGALVEVKGSYNLYDPRTGKKLDSAFASSSYYMHPTTDGIKWGSEFPGVFQVLIVPDEKTTTTLVQGIEYRGMVYAYQVDGVIAFVNEVSIDDYAAAIVSDRTEGQVLKKEALAALAIAARTDALYKSQHAKAKYWHVKAEEVGYQGCAACRLDQPFVEAMNETKQMVLGAPRNVAWFEAGVPLQDIQSKAEAGKDAKEILSEFLHDNQIVLTHK